PYLPPDCPPYPERVGVISFTAHRSGFALSSGRRARREVTKRCRFFHHLRTLMDAGCRRAGRTGCAGWLWRSSGLPSRGPGRVGAVAAGCWWFVWSLPTQEVRLEGRADGIVVLTGGSSRVADAIELLSEGRGKRLLITGVHRATTSAEIKRLAPSFGPMIACC